jgi:hypothetical protein
MISKLQNVVQLIGRRARREDMDMAPERLLAFALSSIGAVAAADARFGE